MSISTFSFTKFQKKNKIKFFVIVVFVEKLKVFITDDDDIIKITFLGREIKMENKIKLTFSVCDYLTQFRIPHFDIR
mgnify:CR=1 FL=1